MHATDLISTSVATGLVYEKLTDVAFRIVASRSHFCVVLGDDGRTFAGLIRLGDVASKSSPGTRILGDLVSSIEPVTVRSSESAESVSMLFAQHALSTAVVVDLNGLYVGLITAESVLKWAMAQIASKGPEVKPAAVHSAIEQSSRASRSGRPSADGPLILIVEDHVESRLALAAILKNRGFEVVQAGAISEAHDAASKHKFALVICDLELPDGSGLELMTDLQREFGLKGIALSGLTASDDRFRSLAAGFSFHLNKPLNLRDLQAAISSVLAETSAARNPA